MSRRRKPRFRASLDPHCFDCQGAGWKPSLADPSRVTRCHCWHRVEINPPKPKAFVNQVFDGKSAGSGQ